MKRLIPILLLLVSGVAHAEEPITGAFGLKFGEAVDGSMKRVEKGDGYLRYTFTPESIVNPFTSYHVYVTSSSAVVL